MSDSHLTINNRSENRQTAISDPSIDVSKGVMFLPWALLTGDFKMEEWCPVRRPVAKTAYEIATRFRRYSTREQITASAHVRRRQKQTRFNVTKQQGLVGSVVSTEHLEYDKDAIPDDFDYDEEDEGERSTELTNSQNIYLQACKMMNVLPNSIIIRNICLTTVDVRNQLMGSQGVRALCIALMKNTTVTSINLMGNNMGIAGGSYVAQVLRENTFIRELNLANNNLGRKGVSPIAKAIPELDVVTSLNLSGNNLKENDGVIIRYLIEECRLLRVLNLSHNCFRETGGVEIGDAIGGYDSIEVLDLSWNHLRRNGAVAIARGIGNSNSLREVNLSWNGFHVDGGKEMGKALDKCSSLQVLDLSGNRIEESCLGDLMHGLKNNSTLNVLKLAHNPITTKGVHFLLQSLFNLSSTGITELDLGELSVEEQSLELLIVLTRGRDIMIRHGAYLGQEVDLRNRELELLNEDPLMVLYQYGLLVGLSPVNFFILMRNKDEILTIEDIKEGLEKVDIPFTGRSLGKFAARIFNLSDVKRLTEYTKIARDFQLSMRRTSDELYKQALRKSDEQTDESRVRAKLRKLIAQEDEQMQQERLKQCSYLAKWLASMKDGKEGLTTETEDETRVPKAEDSIPVSNISEG